MPSSGNSPLSGWEIVTRSLTLAPPRLASPVSWSGPAIVPAAARAPSAGRRAAHLVEDAVAVVGDPGTLAVAGAEPDGAPGRQHRAGAGRRRAEPHPGVGDLVAVADPAGGVGGVELHPRRSEERR